MSWSMQIADIDVVTSADPLVEKALAQNPTCEAQVRAAVDALQVLVSSGAMGDPDKYVFFASLSGHSNPDAEPREGYANDCIVVSVSQGKAKV